MTVANRRWIPARSWLSNSCSLEPSGRHFDKLRGGACYKNDSKVVYNWNNEAAERNHSREPDRNERPRLKFSGEDRSSCTRKAAAAGSRVLGERLPLEQHPANKTHTPVWTHTHVHILGSSAGRVVAGWITVCVTWANAAERCLDRASKTAKWDSVNTECLWASAGITLTALQYLTSGTWA